MIKRCNPLNIRLSADRWQGGIYPPPPEARGFVVFRSTAWGYRAALKILLTYYHRHGLRTIQDIVHRFCPPGDGNNDPHRYALNVSRWMGIPPTAALDLGNQQTLRALLEAMSRQECGTVDHEAIQEALRRL